MHDLLTRGIDEHGTLRSEETHAFKDSPLGRIPAEWGVKTLQHCVRPDAPICYGILMPGMGYDGGIPVIKVKDIISGRVSQKALLLTDPRIDRQYQRSRLHSNDLLITIRGTTGRIALVPPELNNANITQDTARARITSDYSVRFFYFLLQSPVVQEQISLHTIGQAVKGINIADVKKLQVLTPPSREQNRIATQLETMDLILHATEQELVKLRALKTALMQDLLTGTRRVTALLEPEEASV
jgi:type I restriction enzyme S subunit